MTDLLVCWVVYPLVLTALALGWGAGLRRLSGTRFSPLLLPVAGLSVMVVVGSILTTTDATADLTAPVVVIGGFALFLVEVFARRLRPSASAVMVGAGVFAVYGLPVVLSGEATFAGYQKLDDTAIWFAFTDHVMEHGRNLDALPPSSYEATLAFNIGDGYPIGAFLPYGSGAWVTGQDVAWLLQPYIAWLGAVLGLSLLALARTLISSPRLAALVAFIAAQPALLVGYSLWGGIKEVAAAALLAGLAALAFETVALREVTRRSLLTVAVGAAAVLAVLTFAGAIWLLPMLGIALWALTIRESLAFALRSAATVAVIVVVLSLPLVLSGSLIPPMAAPLNSAIAKGNLYEPLSALQAVGIWPATDFRESMPMPAFTWLAIVVALGSAAFGCRQVRRRQAWGAAAFALGSLTGAAVLVAAGSPWVDAKALATAAPAVLFLAMAGLAFLISRGATKTAAAVATVLVAGVVLSNVLAYRGVALAPRDQLAELEEIGNVIGSAGPTLMTEFQPYAVRHFLRDAVPEAVSDLRRHAIPTRSGRLVPERRTADTDELRLRDLLRYRTLVLRRSPAQSRPPGPYDLIWGGDFYEVWQRPARLAAPLAHLPLGRGLHPVRLDTRISRLGTAPCAEVRRLASLAGPGGRLVAPRGVQPLLVPPSATRFPGAWATNGSDEVIYPEDGVLEAEVPVGRSGRYSLWVGGSIYERATTEVDGERIGTESGLINNPGQYVELGRTSLDRGRHEVRVSFSGSELAPGADLGPFGIGPVVVGRPASSSGPVLNVPASEYRSLCGTPLDWIEAYAAPTRA